MSTETTSKISAHQPSKRSRAPPPPTKKPSFEETKNGSQSEQEKDVLKNNGSLEDTGGTSSGDERQLSVVLPGDKIVKASVKKDTPILELLIMIASKNKLNPTNHTIAQPAAKPKDPPVQLKPTQKLSDVVGDTIYIIRRNQKQVFVYKKDEKKSAVYEPTTRITVISSKNHKMCLRVDPEKTLQELLPLICDERGVETSNHTLRLTTQPQESLDMSQTLEKTGAIEFLLVDLKGQPADEGAEMELMPEQKKKKGSIFGKLSKKKKGYEFGGGGFQEPPPSHTPAPVEAQQRSRRHTSPSAFPPSESQTQSATQEDDGSNNTLKKRRPAPPPPPGKHLTSASDDEKLDDESGGSNTLRKRRAPAPPRPLSPPRRTVSLGADAAPQIAANLPPPRPASPPVRASVSGETSLARETIKEAKPPRPPKPPRPTSIIRSTSPETPPQTTKPPEPVFIPPPPPELPPSPSDPQEDVTMLVEQGRLNQSFDENLMDQETREESTSVHSEALSSSVTDTGIDEAFEEVIAMGEADIVDEEEISEQSAPQDSTGLEVNVAGLTLKTKEEGQEEVVELEEQKEEEEEKPEEELKDESSSGKVALQASNLSHANSNSDLGDRDLITHMAETVPAAHLKKLTQKRPVKVYAVYDEAATQAEHSIPAEGDVARRSRAKSDSSVFEVPLRVRSGRSLSVLEKAKPLEGLRMSCVQESIDITETSMVTMETTSTERTCTSVISPSQNMSSSTIESHETSGDDVTLVEDLHEERKATATTGKFSSLTSGSTDKDDKAKMELLSHMMKMSLDEDTKETTHYPPHTQADDTHNMLEEKSVHALAFEVTREATTASENADTSLEDQVEEADNKKDTEDVAGDDQSPKKVDKTETTDTESSEMTVQKKEKADESPSKAEEEKQSPVSVPEGATVQKLNDQYAALQDQMTALQKQMAVPQQAGIMEIQMQQLQQQILLQQQIISQMMMSSNQQPMVMPVAYQQPMISPQQQMMLTPQQMMSPPQQMMSQQMVSPQQQMMSQQMMSPQQQLMMSPQQLLMTPPMMYSQVSPLPPGTTQSSTATATVQAQSTPILSTVELNVSTESADESTLSTQDGDSPSKKDGSPSKEDGSPSKQDDVPTKDDISVVDNVVTSKADTSEVYSEPRPLSPPVKADAVSVGHPTYHFARSRDVPQGETKAVKVSPPNTLRGPKQQQRQSILLSPESSEETGPETKDQSSVDAKMDEAPDEKHTEVDANQNPALEGNDRDDKVEAPKTDSQIDAAKTDSQIDAAKIDSQIDAAKIDGEIDAAKTDGQVDAARTGDKVGSEETSSISAFAVAESNEPVSSSKPKSPKNKKSGFSLFKKKTPKYSYILSAQKEFSRKSETERNRTSSNPPPPTDIKSEGGQGKRGRAHTLDSYGPNKASCGVNFDPGKAECQREMARNVHLPPNLAIKTSEISPSKDQPVIPPRTSKHKTTNTKVTLAESSTQEMTSRPSPSTVVTNTPLLSDSSTNKISVSPSETSSVTQPRHHTVSSPTESKTGKQIVNKSPKSEPSPSCQVIPENSSEATLPISSQTPEVASPGDNPIPPVRKTHSKPNDTSKTQVVGLEVRPQRAATEGAVYERRAQIHNYRSEEEEQAKVKGDASVSQLRQLFGQGNP